MATDLKKLWSLDDYQYKCNELYSIRIEKITQMICDGKSYQSIIEKIINKNYKETTDNFYMEEDLWFIEMMRTKL